MYSNSTNVPLFDREVMYGKTGIIQDQKQEGQASESAPAKEYKSASPKLGFYTLFDINRNSDSATKEVKGALKTPTLVVELAPMFFTH